MRKNIVIFFILLLFVGPHVYAHKHASSSENYVNFEYLKDAVVDSYNHALVWYNEHSTLVRVLAVLGVSYYVYKKYCPVASRCKECLQDSKNI